MIYEIFANKWRPKKFADVVGQDHIIKTLVNSLLLNKVHHSYLFSGDRGLGKTTTARLLAKSLSCEKKITPEPCRVCINCQEIEKNCFLDLIEIDAASRTKVEDIRELLDNVQYASSRGRYKIYLIDEVHMLSKHSFNALLKTLEEPPNHVKFFLATTEIKKLPVTILSRCIGLRFRTLDSKIIYKRIKFILEKEKIFSEIEALKLISYYSYGSMRDALNLVDQAISISNSKITTRKVNLMLNLIDERYSLVLVKGLSEKNGKIIMKIINKLSYLNINWEFFLVEVLRILHHIAMLKFFPKEEIYHQNKNIEYLKKLSFLLSLKQIQKYYKIILNAKKDLDLSLDKRMGVEMIFLEILSS